MELSQSFYEFCKEQLFAGGLEELRGYAAAGLAGEGSECFGYDDDISQDHDFGPDFCLRHTADIKGAVQDRRLSGAVS